MPATEKQCRCGHVEGTGDHPCHNKGYTCGKPATRRFYHQPGPIRYALAGAQMKLSMDSTWACDACWTEFTARLAEVQAQYDNAGKAGTAA